MDAGIKRETFFSPPPSPRPGYADATSASSEYGCYTPTSSDWRCESAADVESEPEPCHEHTKRVNESPSGGGGADQTGGDGAACHLENGSTHSVKSGTAACGHSADLKYREEHGPQIEAWLSDVERRAAQNTNVYLQDGVTPNPARAPYVSLRADGKASQGSWHSDGPEPFWKWSILLQRWIHEDAATGMLLIYPKQLIH